MSKPLETPFDLRSGSRHAFTPEELGILDVKCQQTVQTAIAVFDEIIAGMELNPEQRAEALAIFSERMSAGVDELVETVRQACTRRNNF